MAIALRSSVCRVCASISPETTAEQLKTALPLLSIPPNIACIDFDFRQRMEKMEEDQKNKPQKENDYGIRINGLAKARQQKINELLEHETRQLCTSRNETFCGIF